MSHKMNFVPSNAPEDDVEGHKVKNVLATPEDDVEGHKVKNVLATPEDDVEGHKKKTY